MFKRLIGAIAKRRPIYVNSSFVTHKDELSKRRVLLIGGGGIGMAIARELRDAGAHVIVCGRSLHEFEGGSSEVLDVSKISEIDKSLNQIVKKYKQVDCFINVQGICPEVDFKKDFYNVDQSDYEQVFLVNVESVFFVCQYACEYFERNGIKGNILNICSTEGLKGAVVPYGMSKAAVVSLTKGLGKRMADKGIVINGIAPGATATDMMKMKQDGDLRKNYIPSNRACLPLEIAKAALFLIGDSGKQMCGSILVMDGGESLK